MKLENVDLSKKMTAGGTGLATITTLGVVAGVPDVVTMVLDTVIISAYIFAQAYVDRKKAEYGEIEESGGNED